MKTCAYCAEDILDAAIVCKHCGRDLRSPVEPPPPAIPSPPAPTPPSSGVAAVLCLIIPGAGHMYKGYIGTGFLLLFVTAIGYALFIIPGILMHIIAVATAASVRPYVPPPTPIAPPKSQSPAPVVRPVQGARQTRILKRALVVLALILLGWWLSFVLARQPSPPTPIASSTTISPVASTPSIDQAYQARGDEFAALVYHTGERCPRTTRVLFQGRRDRTEFWNITCANGGSWAIEIDPSGHTKVVSCAVLGLVGVKCFERFP